MASYRRRESSTSSPGLRHQAICIAIGNLSEELRSEIGRQNVELITKLASSRGLINTDNLTQQQEQLVPAIVAKIKQDVSGNSYRIFLEILRSEPSLEPTAKKLMKEVSLVNTCLRSESAIAMGRPRRASSVSRDDSGIQEDGNEPVPGELLNDKKPSGGELVLASEVQTEQPQQASDAEGTSQNVHSLKPQAAVTSPCAFQFPLQESQSQGDSAREILLRNPKAEPLLLHVDEDVIKKKDAKILELEGEIAEKNESEERLQTRLRTTIQEKEDVELRLEKTEIKLKKTQECRDSAMKELHQQLQDKEKEVGKYRSQVAQKEKQNYERLKAAEVKLSQLQNHLAKRTAEYANEIGHLSEQRSELRDQLEHLEEQRSELRDQLEQLKKEVEQLRAEHKELLFKYDSSLSVITEQKAEIEKLRHEVARLGSQSSEDPISP